MVRNTTKQIFKEKQEVVHEVTKTFSGRTHLERKTKFILMIAQNNMYDGQNINCTQ